MSPPSQEANTLFPKSGALSHDSTLPATRNRRDLSTSTSTPAAQILMNIQTNLAAQKERSAQSSAPSPSILSESSPLPSLVNHCQHKHERQNMPEIRESHPNQAFDENSPAIRKLIENTIESVLEKRSSALQTTGRSQGEAVPYLNDIQSQLRRIESKISATDSLLAGDTTPIDVLLMKQVNSRISASEKSLQELSERMISAWTDAHSENIERMNVINENYRQQSSLVLNDLESRYISLQESVKMNHTELQEIKNVVSTIASHCFSLSKTISNLQFNIRADIANFFKHCESNAYTPNQSLNRQKPHVRRTKVLCEASVMTDVSEYTLDQTFARYSEPSADETDPYLDDLTSSLNNHSYPPLTEHVEEGPPSSVQFLSSIPSELYPSSRELNMGIADMIREKLTPESRPEHTVLDENTPRNNGSILPSPPPSAQQMRSLSKGLNSHYFEDDMEHQSFLIASNDITEEECSSREVCAGNTQTISPPPSEHVSPISNLGPDPGTGDEPGIETISIASTDAEDDVLVLNAVSSSVDNQEDSTSTEVSGPSNDQIKTPEPQPGVDKGTPPPSSTESSFLDMELRRNPKRISRTRNSNHNDLVEGELRTPLSSSVEKLSRKRRKLNEYSDGSKEIPLKMCIVDVSGGTEVAIVPGENSRQGGNQAVETSASSEIAEVSHPCQWPEKTDVNELFNRQFLQCDTCDAFYHYRCAGIEEGDKRIDSGVKFICPPCTLLDEPTKAVRKGACENKCLRLDCNWPGVASDDSEDLYVIEKLVGRGVDSDSQEVIWLVKWEGYPAEKCSWTKKSELLDARVLIKQFYKDMRKQKLTAENNTSLVFLKEAELQRAIREKWDWTQ